METVYHLRIKDEQAVRIIEELIQSDAVEDLEKSDGETLTENQKSAVDTELQKISADKNYLQDWNEVRRKFR